MDMNKMKTRPFDMVNYLGSEADIQEYLSQVLEDGEPAELAAALGDIARARGMTQLAKDTAFHAKAFTKASLENEPPAATHFLKSCGHWGSS